MYKIFKIKIHRMYLDDFTVIHIKVTKVKVKRPDFDNPDKVGYDTFENIVYRETEKEVFREFFKLTKNDNLSGYMYDNDEYTNTLTKRLLKKFTNQKTMDLYPEIFI